MTSANTNTDATYLYYQTNSIKLKSVILSVALIIAMSISSFSLFLSLFPTDCHTFSTSSQNSILEVFLFAFDEFFFVKKRKSNHQKWIQT